VQVMAEMDMAKPTGNLMLKVATPRLGFTLVEVLMVVVILGVAATIAVPMLGNTHAMQVTAAARQLASTLHYAQTSAIATQQQVQLVCDVTSNQYQVQDASGNVVANPVSGKPFRVRFGAAGELQDVSLTVADFNGSGTVWFDRMGAPYGGAISQSPPPLASGRITVVSGDEQMTIRVEPVTGRISVN